MPTSKRVAAFAAAGAAFCVVACKDIPLLPKWNADWVLPLPSQAVTQVFGPAAATVPAGTSAAVTFTKSLSTDGPIGDILKQDLTNTSLAVAVVKSIALGGTPTLTIDSSNTFTSAARITVPITLDSSKVAPARDSMVPNAVISPKSDSLLQAVAKNKGTLFVQLAGTVHCHANATCSVTPSDSVLVLLTLKSTIAISR